MEYSNDLFLSCEKLTEFQSALKFDSLAKTIRFANPN
jgi:hypothetical protein